MGLHLVHTRSKNDSLISKLNYYSVKIQYKGTKSIDNGQALFTNWPCAPMSGTDLHVWALGHSAISIHSCTIATMCHCQWSTGHCWRISRKCWSDSPSSPIPNQLIRQSSTDMALIVASNALRTFWAPERVNLSRNASMWSFWMRPLRVLPLDPNRFFFFFFLRSTKLGKLLLIHSMNSIFKDTSKYNIRY